MESRHHLFAPPTTLPNTATAGQNQQLPTPPPRTILLIEDHKESASVLSTVLRMEGFHVLCARTAHEALDLAAAQPVDFIISDIFLPDGDGRDLMARLHAAYRLPGIAMSGADDLLADESRLHNAGFVAVVPKPIEFRDLFAAVHLAAHQCPAPPHT